MMKTWMLLGLLLAGSSLGQVGLRNPAFVGSLAQQGQVWILNQTFEGTDYANGEAWTSDGAADPDATTSPTPYAGSQYLKLGATTSDGADTPDFTAQTSIVCEFWMHVATLGDNTGLFFAGNTGLANYIYIETVGNSLRVTEKFGAAFATTAANISATTWTHVWVRYVKGGVGTTYASVAFSTDNTEPTSGDNFASFSNGTQVFDVQTAYFSGRAVSVMGFDDVLFWRP